MLYKREWLWKRNYIFSFVKHVRRPNYILKLFGSSHTLEVPKLGFDVVCLEVPKLRFDVICLIVLKAVKIFVFLHMCNSASSWLIY